MKSWRAQMETPMSIASASIARRNCTRPAGSAATLRPTERASVTSVSPTHLSATQPISRRDSAVRRRPEPARVRRLSRA